jgi:hypothetical protein
MSKWTSFGNKVNYHRMWKEFVISESSFAQQKKQYETYSLLIKNKNLTPPSEAQIKEAVESFPSLEGFSLDNILDLQDDALTKIVQDYDGDVKNLTKELSFVFYSIITGSSLEELLQFLEEEDSDIEKIEEGLFKSLAGILSSASKQQRRIDSKNAGSGESTKQLKYLDRVKQNAAMAVSLLTVKRYSDQINQIINTIATNAQAQEKAAAEKEQQEKAAAEKEQQEKAAATDAQAQEKQRELQQTLIGYGVKIAEANFPPQGGKTNRERERQRKKRREGAQFYFTLKSYVRQGRGFEVDEVSRRPLYPENATQEEQAALKLVLRGYLKFIKENNIKIEGPTGPKL